MYANDLGVAVNGSYRVNRNRYDESTDRRGYQEEFEAAFRFAARYVGFHAAPETSPGAWVAFRENHVALATNVPSVEERRLTYFNGDYNFLMERLPDKTKGVHTVGPENQRQGAWARVLPPAEKLEVKLDPRFAASFKGGKVRVTFLDEAEAANRPFRLRANGAEMTVMPKGSGRWQTAELTLPDGPLAAASNGAHLSLVAGAAPVCVHMLEVTRN